MLHAWFLKTAFCDASFSLNKEIRTHRGITIEELLKKSRQYHKKQKIPTKDQEKNMETDGEGGQSPDHNLENPNKHLNAVKPLFIFHQIILLHRCRYYIITSTTLEATCIFTLFELPWHIVEFRYALALYNVMIWALCFPLCPFCPSPMGCFGWHKYRGEERGRDKRGGG